ncbi:MAG: peptidylprolyl isomerase [Phycisphaeraceae bacterium]|nr:peptidylprolyl isomerase [Phycisphaeraceae bacterium]
MHRTTCALLLCTLITACQTSAPSVKTENQNSQIENPSPPLAYIDGRPVTLEELRPGLLEIAGRSLLNELILDRALDKQFTDRGWAISDKDIAVEKQLLLETLSDDPDEAARLLAQLRERRSLGEKRFAEFLTRNAQLRALIAEQVEVTPAAIRLAYDQTYGPRYRARVIVTATLREAADLRQRAQSENFAELAMERSIDPSAAAGGLLEPINAADPAYPQAIREVLTRLEPNQVSEPVSVESGFAILKLEATIPGSAQALEDVRDKLAEQVRRRAQRLLMDQLARQLIEQANVVILDGALR